MYDITSFTIVSTSTSHLHLSPLGDVVIAGEGDEDTSSNVKRHCLQELYEAGNSKWE